MADRTRTMRLSHTLSPFGPGAIYDYLGESLLVVGNDRWPIGATRRLGRADMLEQKYGKELRLAPLMPEGEGQFIRHNYGLPVYRFPAWLFCPMCHRMIRWKHREHESGGVPACPSCRKGELVPMRFVAACEDGHLCDVPWDRWAHSSPGRSEVQAACRRDDTLEFRSSLGGSGNLSSLSIHCRTCEAARDLEQIPGKASMPKIGWKCPGKQPWQYDSVPCDKPLVVVQRGASNLWFGNVDSAITIPPFSDYDPYGELETRLRAMDGFAMLQNFIKNGQGSSPFAESLTETLAGMAGCSIEQVQEAASRGLNPVAMAGNPTDIPLAEWNALLVPHPGTHHEDDFITRHQDLSLPLPPRIQQLAGGLADKLDKLVVATRLREIRALTGFRRINFEGESQTTAPGKPDVGWLPALEVRGEGLFLSFREFELSAWEQRRDVSERAGRLEHGRAGSPMARWLPEATPRFVMLHTLSHILMRQLVFECGYSSASLRERIYSSTDSGATMAGILIYTAAGDSEGTMGGLARQGEPGLILSSMVSALLGARWCSSDPICWETTAQGVSGTNMAACHACGLVPETSCIAGNALLDRRLLVDPEFGFLGAEAENVLKLRMDGGDR